MKFTAVALAVALGLGLSTASFAADPVTTGTPAKPAATGAIKSDGKAAEPAAKAAAPGQVKKDEVKKGDIKK